MMCTIAREQMSVSAIEADLEGAQCVVLLQSANVLRQPNVLARLHEAVVVRELPLRCINLVGKGYDFGGVGAFLASLADELSASNEAVLKPYLTAKQLTLEALGKALALVVPQVISIPLDSDATDSLVLAAVKEVEGRLGGSQVPVHV